MGNEYQLQLDPGERGITDQRLEAILCKAPNYHGRVQYPHHCAFEFRTPETLTRGDHSMPDLYVIGQDHQVNICQYGDYDTTINVLGRLVDELVSEATFESITVIKP